MQHQYKNDSDTIPSLGVQIALVVLMAIFCEMANGANFSLVPHVNASHIGLMSGFVGGMGNLGASTFCRDLYALMYRAGAPQYRSTWWHVLTCTVGGIFFALIFRFHTANGYAAAWWISGVSNLYRVKEVISILINICCVQVLAMALNIVCMLIPLPARYVV